MMTITCVRDARDEADWQQFVESHQEANQYHVLAWGNLIHRVFGHVIYYLMARDQEGSVRGVLPLVYMKSPLFGRFLTSMPFLNYGGVLWESADARDALLNAAAEVAGGLEATHIELRQTAPLEIGWPVRSHKVSMRLELPLRYEDLLKTFPSKLRSQLRRGEKEGMITRLGGVDLLDEFYQVFALNWRDLGTPVYEKRWFVEILSAFPKDVRICIVSLEGKPLAAGFVHGFRGTLEILWAPFDRRYARMAPNMMLYGSVLKYACEQGYQRFDFGRSSKDSGAYRFKEQWGARPVQLHWYYWLQSGKQLPEVSPQNPKYRLAVEMWKQLPVAVTRYIGPRVAKYLPL